MKSLNVTSFSILYSEIGGIRLRADTVYQDAGSSFEFACLFLADISTTFMQHGLATQMMYSVNECFSDLHNSREILLGFLVTSPELIVSGDLRFIDNPFLTIPYCYS